MKVDYGARKHGHQETLCSSLKSQYHSWCGTNCHAINQAIEIDIGGWLHIGQGPVVVNLQNGSGVVF